MLRKIIVNHVNENKIAYFKVCFAFILGVCLGVICVNNMNNKLVESENYISDFIKNISNLDNIDIKSLFLNSFFSKSKIIGIIFILSCTIIGGVIIYFLNIYKGFSIGYVLSTLIKAYGVKRGMLFIISTLVLQNIIYIPCIIFFSVYSIIACKNIQNRNVDIKNQIIKNIILFLIILMLSALTSTIELAISYKILKKIQVFY